MVNQTFMDVKLLYWGRARGYCSKPARRVFEMHPYCQLEICVSGNIIMQTPEQKFVLHAGDMLLLPGGIGHTVIYPDADNEFYSLKFEASVPPQVYLLGNSQFSQWCIASLQHCHVPEAFLAMPIDQSNREIVEGTLYLFLQHCRRCNDFPEENDPPLVSRIRNLTLAYGKCLNVTECAEFMQMTAAQLNYQFACTLREYNLSASEYSVKKIIDQALLYLIDRYLDFSDFSLSTIARQMRFNNVYTFSRFYKRMTGIPPRLRRQQRYSLKPRVNAE